MAYRVETTARAECDADNLLKWLLAQDAGGAGLRWFEGLEKAIATLAYMPERCAIAPENARVSFEVRHLLYGRKPHVYRVLFTIEDDAVYVLHIRHGRRKPLTRLSSR